MSGDLGFVRIARSAERGSRDASRVEHVLGEVNQYVDGALRRLEVAEVVEVAAREVGDLAEIHATVGIGEVRLE